MVVKNNLSALNTLNMLNRNHTALAKSLQTVSSGMRINGAKDDASGYAISERMRVQIRSLNQDNQNTQNGHSMMKVAEGAVQSTVDILKTLKEKVINAANDTNTDADRQMIQKELNQSIDQINDNALVTYNEKYLLNGSKNGKSEGTFTALTNSSLYEKTTAATRLVALKDRTGNSLNIQTGDQVTVSYVQEGKTFSTSFTVTDTSSMASIMKAAENADSASSSPTQTFKPSDPTRAAELEADYNAKRITYQGTDGNGGSKGAAAAAQNAYDTYNSKIPALQTAYTALAGQSSNAAAVTAAFGSDFDTWLERDTPSCGLEGYPKPSSITSTMDTYLNILDINLLSGETKAALEAVRAAWVSYTAAYSALNSVYNNNGNKDLAALTTDLNAANQTASDDKDAMNNAYSLWEAANAPEIKNGSEIGTDYFGNTIKTPDFGSALTITANTKGLDGQIAGFTVSVTDTEGNIKKSVNAVLDAWNESIRAENASNDDYALVLQTGTKANQAIKVRMTDMRARALGLMGKDGTTLNVSNQKNANAAINVLDNAIQKALDQQTTIGAIESRLEYTSTNLTTAAENVTASESTIRDADMALAMTQYTKNNILMQASQAMLAQANQSNNQVLSLLR